MIPITHQLTSKHLLLYIAQILKRPHVLTFRSQHVLELCITAKMRSCLSSKDTPFFLLITLTQLLPCATTHKVVNVRVAGPSRLATDLLLFTQVVASHQPHKHRPSAFSLSQYRPQPKESESSGGCAVARRDGNLNLIRIRAASRFSSEYEVSG